MLQNELGKEATIEDLSAYLDWPKDKIKELYFLQKDSLSLSSLVSDDEENKWENLISYGEESFEDSVILIELKNDVQELLKRCNLKDKELTILMLRYGFNDQVPKTLTEVAKMFDVTEEAIRQAESYALYKHRTYKDIENFTIYMDNPKLAMENIEIYRELYQKPKNRRKSVRISENMRDAKRLEKERKTKIFV